jgi:hypothetical protein
VSHNLTQRYSSIILNQNQVATDEVLMADSGTGYVQEFHLPADYRRGMESGELRYPDLSGIAFLVGITPGYQRFAAFDYEVQYQVFGLGWVTVASGVTIGAPNDGDAWMTAHFEEPVEINDVKAGGRWRILFGGVRPLGGDTRDLIVPYVNGEANVMGTQIPVELTTDEPYHFIHASKKAFLYLDSADGEVYFSYEQGIIDFKTTSPNPLALPSFDQAFEPDGSVLVDTAFCFRVLALSAEDGVDFLGNEFRSVVVRNEADAISTALGADPDSFWLSKPNPSKFAVESLYFDMRKQGSTTYGLTNLVTNPSFEIGETAWLDLLTGTGANISPSDDWSTGGTYSLKWEGTAPGGFPTAGFLSAQIPVKPGHTYTLRTDVNLVTLPTGSMGIRCYLIFYNTDDVSMGSTPLTLKAGLGEDTVVSTGVAPPGTEYAIVNMYVNASSSSAAKFYIDSVSVVESATPIYFDGDMEGYVWAGMPHDSMSFEVVEPSADDVATVIDRVLIDPMTPGSYFSIYYSEEGAPGLNEDQWENKLWKRIPQTYRMERKETHVFPEPVKAKYLKIEFSHLQARHYAPGDFQQPIRYKKHPKWVLDYFLARTETDASFLAQRVSVIYDALDLAYNYYLDDLNQEPRTVVDVNNSALTQVTTFLSDRSDVSDRIDPVTLNKVSLALEPYRNHPALRGYSRTLLGDYARQTVGTTEDYPVEISRPSALTTADVSTLNRDRVVIEQNYPVMFFYLSCRHKYREIEARFTHDRAYFVGVRQIAFLRDNYMTAFDTGTYIEPAADTLNVERNEFLDDH